MPGSSWTSAKLKTDRFHCNETRPQGHPVTGGEMPHLAPCRIMLETAVTQISAPNMANLVRLNNNWPEQKVTETA